MTPRGRWSLIALGAIATAIAAYFSPENREATALAARPEPARQAIEWPVRRALGRQRGELFAAYSPPPPAASPAPPAPAQIEAPQPPPNPYRFAGTVEYGGKRRVLLTRGDRIFEVKEGETLEPGFRVQSVTADMATLIYEPLNAAIQVALVFQEALQQAAATAAGATAPAPALR